jgi:YD repeat-containing protein
MFKKIKYLIVFATLALGSIQGYSQFTMPAKNFELDKPLPSIGNVGYMARDYIKLKPGFSFKPESSNAGIKCFIDEFMTFGADYLSGTNPVPTVPFSTSNTFGTIPGKAGVSPTGAAAYTIPISISPGTAGMQPNLSIVYNSQSPGGLLGKGWSIGGFSSITRTAANMFNDGIVDEVDFDSNDKFALDGQRLINLGASTTEFRTENESYLKITITDGTAASPKSFRVETKDGTVMEYGTTPDSRIEAKGKTDVLLWLLAKVTDSNNNYMKFTYHESNGESYPERIEYTGNDQAGIKAYNDITFHFDTKNDPAKMYVGGSEVNQTVILSKIKTHCEGKLVNEYRFKYSYDRFSYLEEIILYGQGTVLNSTKIDWGAEKNQFTRTRPNLTSGVEYHWGDYNADGKADYVRVVPSQNKWELYINNNERDFTLSDEGESLNSAILLKGAPFYTVLTLGLLNIDLNGDGKQDFIRAYRELCIDPHCSSDYIYRYQPMVSDGTGLHEDYAMSQFNYPAKYYPGDFDGDGKSELIFYVEEKNRFYVNFFGKGEGYLIMNSPSWSDNIYPIDFNGNGKTDLLVHNGNTISIYEYQESDKTLHALYQNSSRNWTKVFPGDFNGDMKTDILAYNSSGGWEIAYSTGTNLVIKNSPISKTDDPTANSNDNHYFVYDFDGDGISDIIEIFLEKVEIDDNTDVVSKSYPRLNVYYSNGSSFKKETIRYDDIVVEYVVESMVGSQKTKRFLDFHENDFYFIDVNGDGKTDCFYDDAKYHHLFFFFHKSETRSFVENINDGLNNKVQYVYKTITDDDVYKNGSGNDETSVVETRLPVNVVYQMKQPNGIANEVNISQYEYTGLKLHKSGRGFLGFEKVKVDNTYGYDTETEYKVHPIFFNVIPTKTTTSLNGTNLSEVNYPYPYGVCTQSLDGGKRYRTYVKTKEEKDLLNTITITTTVNRIDDYGNIEEQIVDYNGEGTTKIENTYLKVNGWCKSELDESTTTKTRNGETYIRKINNNYANGHLSETIADAGDVLTTTTSYSDYNAVGLPETLEVTGSGKTKTTHLEYDLNKRFVKTKTFKGPDGVDFITRKTHDSKTGNVLTKTDAQGNTTSYQYDSFGRLIKTTIPNGNKVTLTTTWANGNGPTGSLYYSEIKKDGSGDSRVYYDILGRKIQSETAGFNGNKILVKTFYDSFGRAIIKSEPHFDGDSYNSIRTYYESTGRIDYITTPTGTINYSYPEALQIKVTNQAGQSVTKTLNAFGELNKVTDNGGTIDYTYYPSGLPKPSQQAVAAP